MCVCVSECMYVCVCVSVCMCVCVCKWVYVCVCVSECMYVCVCVWVSVCMCVWVSLCVCMIGRVSFCFHVHCLTRGRLHVWNESTSLPHDTLFVPLSYEVHKVKGMPQMLVEHWRELELFLKVLHFSHIQNEHAFWCTSTNIKPIIKLLKKNFNSKKLIFYVLFISWQFWLTLIDLSQMRLKHIFSITHKLNF